MSYHIKGFCMDYKHTVMLMEQSSTAQLPAKLAASMTDEPPKKRLKIACPSDWTDNKPLMKPPTLNPWQEDKQQQRLLAIARWTMACTLINAPI